MAVDKQIMNRRQGIFINDIVPEILTEAQLKTDGFITTADYPSASVAGVLKISASYGVAVASTGNLTAATRTTEQYDSAPATLIIGKGTLENIKLSLVLSVLNDIADVAAPDAEDGTVVSGLYATRVDGEWSWGFGTITPPEPGEP